MPIEKDLQNTREILNSTKGGTPFILNKGENKTSFLKIQKVLSTHRFQARQKLSFKPLHFPTVVTFLPFAFGFAQFVYNKYTPPHATPFLDKTVPGFRVLNPKLSFETLEYISKFNLLNKEQGLDNENLLKTKTDRLFVFGQPNFIAKIENSLTQSKSSSPDFSLNPFTGLSCQFYTLQLRRPSTTDFSTHFDELPSYLKTAFQQKSLSKQEEGATRFLAKEGFDLFQKKETSKQEKSLSSFSSKKKIRVQSQKRVRLTPFTENETLSLVSGFTKPLSEGSALNKENIPLFKVDPLKSEFYKNRFQFYENVKQLESLLQNLFIETTFYSFPVERGNKSVQSPRSAAHASPSWEEAGLTFQKKDSTLLKNLVTDFSNVEYPLLMEQILDDFAQKRISPEWKGFRTMSGYMYPDMNVFDLYWFYKQKSFLKKFLFHEFQLEKPSLGSVSKKYHFHISNFPLVLIETKKVLLKNSENTQVFYKGPGLVVDSETGFDWKSHPRPVKSLDSEKTSSLPSVNLRSWFQRYVSPYNSLVNLQENFFGIYHSPEVVGNEHSRELNDFSKTSLLSWEKFPINKETRWDLVRDPLPSNFTPFEYSLHIPSYGTEKNQGVSEGETNFFSRGVELKLHDTENSQTKEHFLPVIQLQQPKLKFLNTPSTTLESSSSFFETGLIGKVDYTVPTNFFTETLFRNTHGSGRYKKISSIFSKTTKPLPGLMDNWEPLTTSSWLLISQLSFAVFIFQILKALADNYGRELLGYLVDLVSALGVLDDSLKQEIELLTGQREKGFRLVLKSQKNFTHIAGIRRLLPEIYELVWFLRNSARDFVLSKSLPRGVLLTGPPGTGKTLLVQALAGEAQVPVLVLSGSSLLEPGESGAVKLEMLFQEARQVAPCIVFIDEIDTLAQKRSGVVQNPMGADELLESLTSFETSPNKSPLEELSEFTEKQTNQKQTESSLPREVNREQLSLLMQFLIELDGIQGRDGVIVIGATNRPEVLDPAVLRPGRFEKIVQVGLPGQQKRIEILKLYGQALGYESELSWDYLGQRTAGFTAADLATLMNESSIKAILNETAHTIETIEHGIDRLTTSQTEKPVSLKTKPLTEKNSLLRLAYYQAGKVVISQILETHPNVLVASLWPRRTNIRSLQITTNLQNSVFQFARLVELHERLIGSYAGKAAEFLFLESFSKSAPLQNNQNQIQFCNVSTLGLDDLLFAQKLVYSLVEKWSFYSKKYKIQKALNLSPNMNSREFSKHKDKLEFYNTLVETIETPPMTQALETDSSSLVSTKEKLSPNYNAQMYYSIPWWQQEISSELEFVEKNFANWSRLYLSNPEQSERNPEWLPPDEFYHRSSSLKNVKRAFGNFSSSKNVPQTTNQAPTTPLEPEAKKADVVWNDVAKITRDYPVHSLVLQGFNKTLVLLNQNRELLDRVSIELLYHEILRQPELDKLFSEWKLFKSTQSEKSGTPSSSLQTPNEPVQGHFESQNDTFDPEKLFEVVEASWGLESRKKVPRWVDFEILK